MADQTLASVINRGPIRRRRLELGWSQEELAQRCGVVPQTVMYWERGSMPRHDQFEAIAEALDYEGGRAQLIADLHDWKG